MRASAVLFALAAPLMVSAAIIRDTQANDAAVLTQLYSDIRQHTGVISKSSPI